ncbi:MAG TPA: class I SAM-dependent methyltransferase [Ignavibacteriaceae bacterium]|nr:class I SAM-dependent methyltransferase [Ignavibacteriaceae bacterium]
MDTKQAYDLWSKQYDSNENKTRDLEAKALRKTLEKIDFDNCLEIGCGTGKNTEWLLKKANHITAVDLSVEMIAKAKEKISSLKVHFINADITKDWNFTKRKYDLITFSLVLEHIQDLDHIFKEASKLLKPGGYIYLGELHPYKQYLGTKARFETDEGLQILDCYLHNISDFIDHAKQNSFEIKYLNEFFDNNERTTVPRVLTILFRKSSLS